MSDNKLFEAMQKAIELEQQRGLPEDAVIFEIDVQKLMAENEKLKQQIKAAEEVIKELSSLTIGKENNPNEIAKKYWKKHGKE